MKQLDFYSRAHLIVAAIRICEHQHAAPPSVDDVCGMLSYPVEQGYLLCRKLADMGIINSVEGAFGEKITINDHLLIEKLPRGLKEKGIEEDLKKFQKSKEEFTQKVEAIQKEQAEKKKDLFAELDRQLKEKIEKQKK